MDYNQENISSDIQDNLLSLRNASVSPTSSVHIKTEALPPEDTSFKHTPIKEEQRYEEDAHIDHSYINDNCTVKFPQKLSPQTTLQEIKVRPQFVKEEASVDEEVRVKTESNWTKNKLKCTSCSLTFRNKYIYNRHRDACNARVFSRTFSNRNAKYRVQKYNAIILRKLIDCVKSNPCLYDTDNENFNNPELKTVLWANIATECNFSNASIVINEWKSLKNQFIKAITHHNMPNSSSRHWQHEKQMEFLMPYITDEDVHMNIRKEKPTNETPATLEDATNANEEIIEEDNIQRPPRLKRMSVSSTPENYNKRKRDDERPTTSYSQSQPLDMFFLSMCATTKNLPEYVQLQVKKKIFQAVIEAEEIVAAMHNDQEKNNLLNDDYENDMSPFSVHSNVNESWEDN